MTGGTTNREYTVTVKTASPYRVIIAAGAAGRIGSFLNGTTYRKAAVIADRNAAKWYGYQVTASLEAAGITAVLRTFPPGEARKNLTVWGKLLNFLAEAELSRSDAVIALGGGVAGDLAGFAAATYLRGVDFIQIPTTLLAMADAAVGGKSAVNLPAGKNLAGAFHQPKLVLCDTETLTTLPERELSNGAAEVIKTAMLSSPAILTAMTSGNWRKNAPEIIRDCVNFKGQLTAADELDRGDRQLLNFGHTIGHALERATNYRLPHGEAVAIGMMTATRAAAAAGYTDEETCRQLQEALTANHLPLSSPLPPAKLMPALAGDKKNCNGRLTVIIPERPGQCRRQAMTLPEAEAFFTAGMTGEEQ